MKMNLLVYLIGLSLGRGKFQKRVIEKNIVYGCALYQIIKGCRCKEMAQKLHADWKIKAKI
jgi:hypothetical protein